jgi:hypothetical protein
MFHKIFQIKSCIELHSQAPYLKERLIYLDYWQKHGATLIWLKRISQVLLIIANNIKLDSKKLINVKEIDKTFKQLAYRSRSRNHKQGKMLVLRTRKFCLGHAKKWLRMIGRLNEIEIDYPFSKQLFSYEHYLRTERGLTETYIETSNFILKIFLRYLFKKKLFPLTALTYKISMIFLLIKQMRIILATLLVDGLHVFVVS